MPSGHVIAIDLRGLGFKLVGLLEKLQGRDAACLWPPEVLRHLCPLGSQVGDWQPGDLGRQMG